MEPTHDHDFEYTMRINNIMSYHFLKYNRKKSYKYKFSFFFLEENTT